MLGLWAGLIGIREDEQRNLLLEWNMGNSIPIASEHIEFEIGETYLFVLNKLNGPDPVVLNPYQAAYTLESPQQKIDNRDFTVKNIISEFGKEKWNSFNAEFKKSDSIYKADK